MRERQHCYACASDEWALGDCLECGLAMCKYHLRRHVCGVDDRPEGLRLLGPEVTKGKARGVIVYRLPWGAVGFDTTGAVLSRRGVCLAWEGLEAGPEAPWMLCRMLRERPLRARWVCCLWRHSQGSVLAHDSAEPSDIDLFLRLVSF